MKNKILFYCLFIIGFISLFLPFDIDVLIQCDFISTSSYPEQTTTSFIAILKNVSFRYFHFKNILEIILSILILPPFIFSAIFFHYKKYTFLLIFNIIPLIFLVTIGIMRKLDGLQIGYYLLTFQQAILFFLLIKIKYTNCQIKLVNH